MQRTLISCFIFALLSLSRLEGAENTLTTDSLDFTADGDVIGSGAWSQPSGGFRIESSVTQALDLYTYSYWITNSAEWYLAEDFDTFLIEIGDPTAIVGDVIKDLSLVTNASSFSLELNTFDLSSFGPLGSIYGLEFDLTTPGLQHLYLEFQSYMAPTAGDFFAKGIGGTYSYNAALTGGDGFVYVPDAVVSTPEPSTYFMLGTMLFATVIARKRKEKRLAPD
jgi:hypothetical protein